MERKYKGLPYRAARTHRLFKQEDHPSSKRVADLIRNYGSKKFKPAEVNHNPSDLLVRALDLQARRISRQLGIRPR